MPFIPHTENETAEMLKAIGASHIEKLFDEIPAALKIDALHHCPDAQTEMELLQDMSARAKHDHIDLCFMGAGAYEHHIPAAVWDLTARGEFMTAYTPYQAEASQGTLQLLYEYQSMMCRLTGMDVSNASLYDGASALAEALLMAVRCHKTPEAKNAFVLGTLNPRYKTAVEAIVSCQNIGLTEIPFDAKTGTVLPSQLPTHMDKSYAALIIPHPNFFGGIEAVDALTDWAHDHHLLVIAVANPTALALLKEPGAWGKTGTGADIVCGEGQPLGIPLSSGGPYFGFLCCKQAFVRQMPGRIIGRTIDTDGKQGFTLTLQAREQHIRRAKATSNICTNQGLLVTAASIYLALLGPEGLKKVAEVCHTKACELLKKLLALPGVTRRFASPFFHEFVLDLPKPVQPILENLANQSILGGYALSQDYPELKNSLLICVTETKTTADLDRFVTALSKELS